MWRIGKVARCSVVGFSAVGSKFWRMRNELYGESDDRTVDCGVR